MILTRNEWIAAGITTAALIGGYGVWLVVEGLLGVCR